MGIFAWCSNFAKVPFPIALAVSSCSAGGHWCPGIGTWIQRPPLKAFGLWLLTSRTVYFGRIPSRQWGIAVSDFRAFSGSLRIGLVTQNTNDYGAGWGVDLTVLLQLRWQIFERSLSGPALDRISTLQYIRTFGRGHQTCVIAALYLGKGWHVKIEPSLTSLVRYSTQNNVSTVPLVYGSNRVSGKCYWEDIETALRDKIDWRFY